MCNSGIHGILAIGDFGDWITNSAICFWWLHIKKGDHVLWKNRKWEKWGKIHSKWVNNAWNQLRSISCVDPAWSRLKKWKNKKSKKVEKKNLKKNREKCEKSGKILQFRNCWKEIAELVIESPIPAIPELLQKKSPNWWLNHQFRNCWEYRNYTPLITSYFDKI